MRTSALRPKDLQYLIAILQWLEAKYEEVLRAKTANAFVYSHLSSVPDFICQWQALYIFRVYKLFHLNFGLLQQRSYLPDMLR